jgi:hypothetical protein
MRYRIKQIAETTFIPQCKNWCDFDWANIDREGDSVLYDTSWYSRCESLELAKTTIEKYKSYLKLEKQYPKYYKV